MCTKRLQTGLAWGPFLPPQAVWATVLLWSSISCWSCGHPCLCKYIQECSFKNKMAYAYISHDKPCPSVVHKLCKLAMLFARIHFQVLSYLIYLLDKNMFLLRLVRRPVILATEETESGGSQVQVQPGLQSESKVSSGNSIRPCFQIE